MGVFLKAEESLCFCDGFFFFWNQSRSKDF